MLSLSNVQTVTYQKEYFLSKLQNFENSFYESFGVSLFDLFSTHVDLKFQFYHLIQETIEEDVDSKKPCEKMLKILKETENDSLLQELHKENNLSDMVSSIYYLARYVVNDTDNFFEEFSNSLGISIEIHEKNTISRYGFSEKQVKLLKKNSQYYSLIAPQSNLKDLMEILSGFSELNFRAFEISKGLMKNSGIPLENFSKGLNRFKECTHKKQFYKTLCGKNHCAYCLADNIKEKRIEKSFCLCNLHISPKNYSDLIFFLNSR